MIKTTKSLKILIIVLLVIASSIGFFFVYRSNIDGNNIKNTNSSEKNNQSDLFNINLSSTNFSILNDNLITNGIILFNGSFSSHQISFYSGIGYDIRFNWSFGDNSIDLDYNYSYNDSLNQTTLYSLVNHTYALPGLYLVNLTVEKRWFLTGETFERIGFCSKEIIIIDHT